MFFDTKQTIPSKANNPLKSNNHPQSNTIMPVNKEEIEVGDRVEYHPVGGAVQLSTGVVEEIVTETQAAGDTGVTVKASDDEPRIVIKNENTGKSAAYKLTNIERKL
jgi:hypothetical protein